MREPYSQEAEQGLLGSMLIRPELVEILCADLVESDFYWEDHQNVFKAIRSVSARNRPVDVVTIGEYLVSMSNGDSAIAFAAELHRNTPSAANAKEYARIVKERSIDRQLMEKAKEVHELAFSSTMETSEKLAAAQAAMMKIESGSGGKDVLTAAELMRRQMDEIDRRALLDGKMDGLATGIAALDAKLLGLKPGQLLTIAGRPKMGKAQPLTAKVLLAHGRFKLMGELQVGDLLASVDGKPSHVVSIHPQGMRPIYAVKLADGRVIEADAEHLWQARNSKWDSDRTLTTLQLAEECGKVRNRKRLTLVGHSGEFGQEFDMGISPWLLGFLIGDGCLRSSSVRFSAAEEYILGRVSDESEVSITHVSGYDYSLSTPRGQNNPILSALQVLGLAGKRAEHKFIPYGVMFSSKHIRQQVLAGLLESDGWVEKKGAVMFASASRDLRDNVVELVQSLGGSARKSVKSGRGYSRNGIEVDCLDSYVATIRLSSLGDFIRSPRLRKNLRAPKKTDQSPVVSVDFLREDFAQCIKVSHGGELYITDGWTVTHNTTLAMNIAAHNALEGKSVLVFSFEMMHTQLMDRMISSVGEIPLRLLQDGTVFNTHAPQMTSASSKIAQSGLHLSDRKGLNITQIRSHARRHKMNHGLDMIVVDHIGLVSGTSPGQNDVQRVTEITKGMKLLAMELGVPVIELSQLNRELERRPDKRPICSDLRDSGSIEQDSDIILFVYRDEIYNVHTDDWGKAELIIGAARDIPQCTVKVGYTGKYSKFYDLEKDVAPAQARKKPQPQSRGLDLD